MDEGNRLSETITLDLYKRVIYFVENFRTNDILTDSPRVTTDAPPLKISSFIWRKGGQRPFWTDVISPDDREWGFNSQKTSYLRPCQLVKRHGTFQYPFLRKVVPKYPRRVTKKFSTASTRARSPSPRQSVSPSLVHSGGGYVSSLQWNWPPVTFDHCSVQHPLDLDFGLNMSYLTIITSLSYSFDTKDPWKGAHPRWFWRRHILIKSSTGGGWLETWVESGQ